MFVVRHMLHRGRGRMPALARALSSGLPDPSSGIKVTTPEECKHVRVVTLSNEAKRNALNVSMWEAIGATFNHFAESPGDVRAVVLAAEGPIFCAGIDLSLLGAIAEEVPGEDFARRAYRLRNKIRKFQDAFTALERCPQPVIAAVQGLCVGGGVDLVTAADIRLCDERAAFCVKEVDVGLVADVGTVQRLTKVIGSQSLARELIYTARDLPASEALSSGLVSRVLPDADSLRGAAIEMAATIAGKSPMAVAGSKRSVIHARDHTVEEGLIDVSLWNAASLMTEDMKISMGIAMGKIPKDASAEAFKNVDMGPRK